MPRGYRGRVTWWGVFVAVVGVLVVGALVAAALLDRQARRAGSRYHPEIARKLRTQRGELRQKRAAQVFHRGRRGPDPSHPERYF
jgi:hypothetical protein